MNTHGSYLWLGAIFSLLLVFGPATGSALACGGGGGGDDLDIGGSIFTPYLDTLNKVESGGADSHGSVIGPPGSTSHFMGASPKAVEAYQAAGGPSGTGMSFSDWFKKTREQMDEKQEQLTWDGTTAAWSASALNAGYWGAWGLDKAGKIAQFGLNFVPGFGWVNVSLDTARGAAEGYAEAIDQGLEQGDAFGVGAKTGAAQGIMSAGFNYFGLGNRFGTDKAVLNFQNAVTPKQVAKAGKALKRVIVGNLIDTGVQEYVGNEHASETAKNTTPRPGTIR
jgi:hypothetical protein